MRPMSMFRPPADFNPYDPLYGPAQMMENPSVPYEHTMQPFFPGHMQGEMFPNFQAMPINPMQMQPNYEAGGLYGKNSGPNMYPQQQFPYPPIQPSMYSPPVSNGMNNSPFANPLQAKKTPQQPMAPYPNPYPKQQFMQKAQPSGFQSIMNQFKTQDGSMDVTKLMNTAGQMMGTVSQMQGMFKGLGSLFKTTT